MSVAELHQLRIASEGLPEVLDTSADDHGGLTVTLNVSAGAPGGQPVGLDGAAIMVVFSSVSAGRDAARGQAAAALRQAEEAVRQAQVAHNALR